MKRVHSSLALFCSFLVVASQLPAQETSSSVVIEQPHGGFLTGLRRPYLGREVAPVNLSNTGRLESLIRAGKIYLSLQDVLALALENNLDIEVQRYTPLLAQQALLRAKAGGPIRGVSASVTSGPGSAGGGSGSGLSSNLLSNTNASSNASSSNTILQQIGPSTPNLDPVLTGTVSWGHTTQPQSVGFLTGTTSSIQTDKVTNIGLQQGFLTGATARLSFQNNNAFQNSPNLQINPYTRSAADLFISQPLLQGFGFAVNNRNIRIAKNTIRIDDLVFKQQVITTLSSIINLYWDLVSFNEDVRVKKKALDYAQKLYEDNKKQVEIGTLAPIEIVRAEAEVASRQQDLTISETNVLQQETIIKNALSRTGIASPSVAEVRIVPTDRIRIPDVEAIEPVQDLISKAMENRPELGQSRIAIESTKITIKGDRNGLLPTINAFVDLTNNALAGQVNNVLPQPGVINFRSPTPDPFVVGGYGTVLSQIFGRNFPDYRFGVQMTIPLRNRAAQADAIYDQLTLRQQELQLQRQVNGIRVDVQNALIGLQQARARYQATVKNRVLQEQVLEAEQKKYQLGASTVFFVIQYQRDLANAEGTEVNARSAYSRAKVTLDQALGTTLQTHNVSIEEAYRGKVSRPPSTLPVLDNGASNQPQPLGQAGGAGLVPRRDQ